MPVITNPKLELFAQELAKGLDQADAYRNAGYAGDKTAACRAANRTDVRARVEEIQAKGAARAEVTVEKVLRELAKIGFSDIRKAVKWYSQTNVAAVDTDADMEALAGEGALRFAVANQVELVSSDDIDDDTAAAIAEVSQSATGGLKVKFHDKKGALVDLGRHLGMFKDRTVLENPDGSALNQVVIFKLPDNGR